MKKKKTKNSVTGNDSALWERLAQVVKVEEPVELNSIRKRCRGVPLNDLLFTLAEMEKAGSVG